MIRRSGTAVSLFTISPSNGAWQKQSRENKELNNQTFILHQGLKTTFKGGTIYRRHDVALGAKLHLKDSGAITFVFATYTYESQSTRDAD